MQWRENHKMKTYRMVDILFCLILFLFAFGAAAQTNAPVVQFGESNTLHSKILNQDRPYWVCLPASYHAKANRQRYPVLYVLDAEWNFYWASEVVQFMRDSRQIPYFIVVGVPNIDREHDLTPAHDPNAISSGGEPLFERFLTEELAAEINAKFRTVSYRILVGHSMGGALAADAFLRQTTGFGGYIAIDPSLGWDNQVLVRRAKEFVPQVNSRAAIFIATAGWRDLNPTNLMTRSQELFVSILRRNSPPGIRIGYEVESEDHNSSRLLGLYDGLRFIFEGYKPMDPFVLKTPLLINEHFEQLSSRLGFKILPAEGLVSGIGAALLDAHEPDKAVEVIKLNITNYPTSAYAYRFLASAYLAAGKKELAIKNYKKALELDPNAEGVKDALAKLREK
ncbi:putative Tetratricopeptide TPR_1 repeat-containing protein [Verrucomicrobia bacterium]|nr:putative Tetratricopeptide TPR_1 repeat-containing protein [Verrucomicrobiota bacterium]